MALTKRCGSEVLDDDHDDGGVGKGKGMGKGKGAEAGDMNEMVDGNDGGRKTEKKNEQGEINQAIGVQDIVYSLTPPNQCDWMYTITSEDGGETWRVRGVRHDPFEGTMATDTVYVWDRGHWMRRGG